MSERADIWVVAYNTASGLKFGLVEMSFEDAAETAIFLNDKTPGIIGGIARFVQIHNARRIEEFISFECLDLQDEIH